MLKIIIACHGKLASELKQSSFIIFGEQDDVVSVDYLEDEEPADLEEKFTAIFDKLPANQEVLILTDLYLGQPFNTAKKFVDQKTSLYHLISGVNLAMLLESYTVRQEKFDLSYLEIIGQEAIQSYRGQEDA